MVIYDQQYIEAEKLLLESVKVASKSLDGDHFATLKSKEVLGMIYQGLGRWSEAKNIYEHLIPIYEATCGHDYHHTMFVMQRLGQLYMELKDHDGAIFYNYSSF